MSSVRRLHIERQPRHPVRGAVLAMLPSALAILTALFFVECAALRPNPPAMGALTPALSEPEPTPEPVVEPAPDLVDVSAPRELRGLWVATVFNLDFPSRVGLSPAEARAELAAIADGAAEAGLNALVFQVRPEGDAFYASEREPWSRYLTGRQGADPGYDPLQILIEEARARNLEVHAWFNPYRAAGNRRDARAPNHISRTAAGAVRTWGNMLWLDPGVPEVQQAALDAIDDVVSGYDIDGVHIDDYFYPYPQKGVSFPDAPTYQAYRARGGDLSRADWRRANVDSLVQRIFSLTRARCPSCRMGISPFGIYRPGQPVGARGLDQVEALYADPMLWYDRGWADYLAPQLYWPTSKSGQAYDLLLPWWDRRATPERPLIVGLDATKVGSSSAWSLDEVRTQVRLAREAPHTHGQIWFRAHHVLSNHGGLLELMKEELYPEPALPPPTPGVPAPAPPELEVEGPEVRIVPAEPRLVRTYALYRAPSEEAPLAFVEFLPATTRRLTLEPGTWAVSAVVKGAVESPGVRVTVP